MTDFTSINLPTAERESPSILMIDGIDLCGFSQSDADRIIQTFQAAIESEWAMRSKDLNQLADLRIDDLKLTINPRIFETPDRLGRELAGQLMREIF